MRKFSITKKQFFDLQNMVDRLLENKKRIDSQIGKEGLQPNIDLVERNILRWAIYLLQFQEEELAMVIAETIRLCNKFAKPECSALIQAVLNRICSQNI